MVTKSVDFAEALPDADDSRRSQPKAEGSGSFNFGQFAMEDPPEPTFVMTNSSDSSDRNPVEFLRINGIIEHPSRGSERHLDGRCQPCCFFARGKCTVGKGCLYCHYPHQRQHRPGKKSRERAKKRQQQDLGLDDGTWQDGDVPEDRAPPYAEQAALPPPMPHQEVARPQPTIQDPSWQGGNRPQQSLPYGKVRQRDGAILLCL
mmetsp:Transcript_14377/g.26459  ORF Transcript_14377/g.26459 Transcript_14377/m.26459 type:complete len:204 (+) Transcript_14377:69-680(+)